MKKIAILTVVVISSLIIAIACDPDAAGLGSENEAAVRTEADDADALEAAIDKENSVVHLGTVSRQGRGDMAKAISVERFLDAVGSLKSGHALKKIEENGNKISAENNVYAVRLNIATGQHAVQLKEAAYDSNVENAEIVEENVVVETARSLYSSLGISDDEAKITVSALMSGTRDLESGEELETREEGKIVFIDREIDGIPVAGDRISMLTHRDGTVNNIVGRWTPVDYAKSKFSTHLTRRDVFNRAAKALERSGAEVGADQRLQVTTHYEIVENADGSRSLQLAGEVDLPVVEGHELYDSLSFSVH